MQTFIVALFAGVIATVLFFWATDLVRSQPENLAAVEATQSGAVFFALYQVDEEVKNQRVHKLKCR